MKTCSIEGCDKKVVAHGYCMQHYRNWKRNGNPVSEQPHEQNKGKVCSVEGCDREAKTKGLCDMHYDRMLRTGTTDLTYGKEEKCARQGCDRKAGYKGYCINHYRTFARREKQYWNKDKK